MKTIAGNYFGTNIQFVCRYCNCVFEVESRSDWKINMFWCKVGYKVPEYIVICPSCGYSQYLGFDSDDLQGTQYENLHCPWIPFLKEGRKDWNERYRINPIRE